MYELHKQILLLPEKQQLMSAFHKIQNYFNLPIKIINFLVSL